MLTGVSGENPGLFPHRSDRVHTGRNKTFELALSPVPHGKEDKPMHSKTHSHGSIFGMHWDPTNAALPILLVLLFLILLIMSLTLTAQPAMGQTFVGNPQLHRSSGRILLYRRGCD